MTYFCSIFHTGWCSKCKDENDSCSSAWRIPVAGIQWGDSSFWRQFIHGGGAVGANKCHKRCLWLLVVHDRVSSTKSNAHDSIIITPLSVIAYVNNAFHSLSFSFSEKPKDRFSCFCKLHILKSNLTYQFF